MRDAQFVGGKAGVEPGYRVVGELGLGQPNAADRAAVGPDDLHRLLARPVQQLGQGRAEQPGARREDLGTPAHHPDAQEFVHCGACDGAVELAGAQVFVEFGVGRGQPGAHRSPGPNTGAGKV